MLLFVCSLCSAQKACLLATLVLCLMLLPSYYDQNYAAIIDSSLWMMSFWLLCNYAVVILKPLFNLMAFIKFSILYLCMYVAGYF